MNIASSYKVHALNPCWLSALYRKIDIIILRLLEQSAAWLFVINCFIPVYVSIIVCDIQLEKQLEHNTRILPVLLALSSMLSGTHLAPKYASVISGSPYLKNALL